MEGYLSGNKQKKSPLTLGISSILLAFLGAYIVLIIAWPFLEREITKRSLLSNFSVILITLYYISLILMAIWGLVRGIKLLKLGKKTKIILGIILSLLGLISAIFIGWLVVGMLFATI